MHIPSWILYAVLVASMLATFFYTRAVESESLSVQQNIYNQLETDVIKKYTFGESETPLYIPSQKPFVDGNPWMHVSSSRLLAREFEPASLTNLTVPFSESEPQQVHPIVNEPLERLFAKATADGYDLMIASAYRSVDEQQSLYEEFVSTRGAEAAEKFVATPRGSEHHTGLAIDIDDLSTACRTDSFSCSLSPGSAQWLRENAPSFGFILRYPEGKKSITGISAEQWHYRYVGVPLATRLSESNLTFDEFIMQVAPGRIDSELKSL